MKSWQWKKKGKTKPRPPHQWNRHRKKNPDWIEYFTFCDCVFFFKLFIKLLPKIFSLEMRCEGVFDSILLPWELGLSTLTTQQLHAKQVIHFVGKSFSRIYLFELFYSTSVLRPNWRNQTSKVILQVFQWWILVLKPLKSKIYVIAEMEIQNKGNGNDHSALLKEIENSNMVISDLMKDGIDMVRVPNKIHTKCCQLISFKMLMKNNLFCAHAGTQCANC